MKRRFVINIRAYFKAFAAVAALIAAAGAFAQEPDSAYVPFRVNVDAEVTARRGAAVFSMDVTKDAQKTLALPLGGVSVSYRGGVRGLTNTPAITASRGKVTLVLPPQSYKNADIALYSINGRRVMGGKAAAADAAQSISRRNLAAGTYLLSAKGANGGAFTARLTHRGGNLNINVAFAAENASRGGGREKAAAAEEWKITVSAPGYTDSAYALSAADGQNDLQDITLMAGQVRPPSSSSIPRSGHFADALTFTLPQPGDGVTLCCDTSGRLPTKESALRSDAALNLTKTTVIRCAQFKDGMYPSEAIMRTYIIGERLPDLPVFSIAVDPYSMFDSTNGLYATGPNAERREPYYGANYWRDDELPVQIDYLESGAKPAWNSGAGLRIFGNWSRSNAKKSVLITFREEYGQKNLKYGFFPEHPNLTKFKHFILRNNGNNFPQDYIRDMLMTSLTEGLSMDYQKGRAAIVYYNGQYFGIHNLRERANGDYFETNYNIDEELIDLVKVKDDVVSSGSDDDYQDIVRWLKGVTLDDNNMEELERRIDVGDFTNHHQFRIYYNDRDWPGNNMKRWRVNSPPSKWKWLMYDTDHGFDSYGRYEQPNVGMLTLATAANGKDWPNPPYSTFMLRKLLENEGYKHAFINRFSLLIATYFAPTRVGARIDTLMGAIANEMPLDMARWKHKDSVMTAQLNVIRNFGNTRGARMQSEIGTFFKLSGAVDLTLSAGSGGNVSVHGLQVLGGSAAFKAYPTVPVVITAIPDAGMRFDGWSDGVAEAERTVSVTGAAALEARFAASF